MSESTTTVRIQNLLDRLRDGDAKARDELITVAYERLRLQAGWMLRDYPRVQRWEGSGDVLHNATFRLRRALEVVPLATAADFFRVAALQMRRELCDLARHYYGPQGQGAHHHSGPDVIDNVQGSSGGPAVLARWTEFHEKVKELPPDEKEVFGLIWYMELGAAEAAKVLEISESSVKRRWQAGRRRLHDLLGGKAPF